MSDDTESRKNVFKISSIIFYEKSSNALWSETISFRASVCMTLIKYWCYFPYRRHRWVRVRHSNLILPSFSVCLFSSLFNWTRCSSWITALSVLSCHDWVYVSFHHETHIQFRRGHRWNDPSFDYDTQTCFLNVRWSLNIQSTLDQSWLSFIIGTIVISLSIKWLLQVLILQYCPIFRMSQLFEHYECPFSQSIQRVTDTRNI